MNTDAQDEPVPEPLPIGGDVRATDVADDDDDDESDYSEMGLEDREGLDDVESDNSGDGGNGYEQDSDDYDDYTAGFWGMSTDTFGLIIYHFVFIQTPYL